MSSDLGSWLRSSNAKVSNWKACFAAVESEEGEARGDQGSMDAGIFRGLRLQPPI